MVVVGIVGNPNVGKSVIFNNLTGAHQKVGNWPGVTVEKKEGECTHKGIKIKIVDLPGIYSLTANSIDELIARDFIVEEKPDVVVDIVDSTNLERNLYLVLQLLELGAKVVVALNMTDLAEYNGIKIDINELEKRLGIRIIPTVATKKIGMKALCDAILDVARHDKEESKFAYSKDLEDAFSEIAVTVKEVPELKKYNPRWLSIKLLEEDREIIEKIRKTKDSEKIFKTVERVKEKLSSRYDDLIIAIADARYEFISNVLKGVMVKSKKKELTLTDMLDEVFTHKYLGIPIFLVFMWTVFQFTFTVAAPFSDAIDMTFAMSADFVRSIITPAWVASLIADGIISGLGFVLVFVPNIFFLFLALAILEDSGYMSRAAFIMDKLMYKLGLHGKSFIPMIMGFGCNVPAIMATRTIESEKDRLVTILVNPLMSCSARFPVYVLFGSIFFSYYVVPVIYSIYLLGIVLAILMALLFKRLLAMGKPSPFVMEMPPYLIPSVKSLVIHMWERGSMFLKKAGTFIVSGLLLIWVLSNIPWGADIEDTLVGALGHAIQPIFAPFGWDWRIAVALFFGFIAKEIVVGSLGILYNTGEDVTSLKAPIENAMTPLSAYALMAFVLIYTPCIATVGVIKQETGSWKWTLIAIAYELLLAYAIALLIITIGTFLGFA